MKTKDVETKTGISRQTIMYYEKEGLITPCRDENGYRNYNDQDIQVLLIIKLLRSMNISIDDIKLVIQNELSFQDCLKTQFEYVEESLDNLQEVKSTISFYKEHNLPMIPALKEVEKIDTQTFLGFQRTSSNITIGRILTKKYLIKKLCIYIFISLIIGMTSYYRIKNIIISIFVGVGVFLIEIIAYGLGLGEMGFFSTQNNATLFIEFDETGINFAQTQTFKDRMLYAFHILKDKDALTHKKYVDIKEVEIRHVKRYMKIPGSQLSDKVNTVDYYFTFNDGGKYAIINPIILDNDREMIEIILNNKIEVSKKY